MGDSQQDTKKRASYESWTKQQSKLLLELMADAARNGWRDNSGIFSKQTVEEIILPQLNEKLKCNKTYNKYTSHLKSLKKTWLFYSNLMKFSSGFGYDANTKRFTASDEVWDDYLKAHPKDVNLRYAEILDYEDLELAVGNGVAVGRNAIGLGSTTDAKILVEDEQNSETRIEDLSYDVENEVFVPLSQNETPLGSTQPSVQPQVSVSEVSSQKKNQPKKRSRGEFEASGSSNDLIDEIKKLTNTFDEVHELMQKRDSVLEKREKEKNYSTWDAIKEIPNLTPTIRAKAFDLLDTKAKKDGFFKMTIEERAFWISYKLGE